MIDTKTMIALGQDFGEATKDSDAINDFFAEHDLEPEVIYMLARVFGNGMAQSKARKRQDLAAAAWVQGFGFALFAAEQLKEMA